MDHYDISGMEKKKEMKEGDKKQNTVRRRMLQPTEVINGYKVRPGIYQSNGAMVINEGVCFTVHSIGATSCTLLLYHREGKKPFARIPFPESFRLGNTFSMIVYDLDITEFEYAYSFDGPYDESKGLLFKKENVI